jgi:phosphoglycolate phosphatase-like HAD superfamily hydrolase
MECQRLVLFDMDGTVVNVAPQHLEAFRVALEVVYGLDVEGVLDRQNYQGDTQPNVIRAACRLCGLSRETTESLLPEALRVASETTMALLQDMQVEALPGVIALLEALRGDAHVLGLVTGTISATTRAILERAGLSTYFSVLACGEEGDERADLVTLAIGRVRRLNGAWVKRSLVVVGDAPRDIETGKAFGARTVAVATGNHTMEELARQGPDVVFPHFGDVGAALAAILAVD